MPRGVSLISSGTQFQRSVGGEGAADQMVVRYRVLKTSPTEFINIPQACGVFIGDPHPDNAGIYCLSFTGEYEGDSRMVLICTFTYGTQPDSSGGGSGSQGQGPSPPELRPANWSTSTTASEAPAWQWKPITGPLVAGGWQAPANVVGDIYDGITRLEPITTIRIEQFSASPPLAAAQHAGEVNSVAFNVGGLACGIRTVLFRGVQCDPAVETWGNAQWRGWKCVYEFTYKRNYVSFGGLAGGLTGDIGWDIAVPHTGFNVRAFAPGGAAVDEEPFGQPLSHVSGKIVEPLALPKTITAGDKVRAMVKVFEYEDGGASQTPSASPVSLTDEGRPRAVSLPPLVHRYQIYQEFDFSILGLRLL